MTAPVLGNHRHSERVMARRSIARERSLDAFELSLANQQSSHDVDEERLLTAARRVLADAELDPAAISLAVIADATIHALNRRFLDHDWPTDVLSFVLEETGGHLEGEVVLSADTAATVARECGWSASDEQLLYVIHGMLHLVGYDDLSDEDAQAMRRAERFYLRECGVDLPENARVVGDAAGSVGRAGGPGGTSAL